MLWLEKVDWADFVCSLVSCPYVQESTVRHGHLVQQEGAPIGKYIMLHGLYKQ